MVVTVVLATRIEPIVSKIGGWVTNPTSSEKVSERLPLHYRYQRLASNEKEFG